MEVRGNFHDQAEVEQWLRGSLSLNAERGDKLTLIQDDWYENLPAIRQIEQKRNPKPSKRHRKRWISQTSPFHPANWQGGLSGGVVASGLLSESLTLGGLSLFIVVMVGLLAWKIFHK